MRGLVMVAHPDDCIIFAWSLMYNFKNILWDICYLTYELSDPRAKELNEFWNRRNVVTKFLGYVDDYRDLEHGYCSFDVIHAATDIQAATKNYDLILTHDQHGDYGHLHHKFVSRVVRQHHDCVITFAPMTSDNIKYSVPLTEYDVSELPMHGSIIRDFHRTEHRNKYNIPPCAELILKG